MSKEEKLGRFPPFSLRLSFDERSQLESAAGDMPLGTYIRKKLLDEKTEPRQTLKRIRNPVKNEMILAKLLAELGKAHLANNLNQIAKAINSGCLQVTPDTEKAVQNAYAEVLWMRHTLVAALGLEPDAEGRLK